MQKNTITTTANPKQIEGKTSMSFFSSIKMALKNIVTNPNISTNLYERLVAAGAGSKIEISYIGYKDQKVKVEIGKSMNIILVEDTEALEEVVVVGFGTQKKAFCPINGCVFAVIGVCDL